MLTRVARVSVMARFRRMVATTSPPASEMLSTLPCLTPWTSTGSPLESPPTSWKATFQVVVAEWRLYSCRYRIPLVSTTAPSSTSTPTFSSLLAIGFLSLLQMVDRGPFSENPSTNCRTTGSDELMISWGVPVNRMRPSCSMAMRSATK